MRDGELLERVGDSSVDELPGKGGISAGGASFVLEALETEVHGVKKAFG